MKWIKTRESYLNEAKLRDVILPRQAKEVARRWGEKYLDYEEIEPTNKIKQGTWKLSEEDKNKVLSSFCNCNIEELYNIFSGLSNNFANVLNKSINLDLLNNDVYNKILANFNINKPNLDQIIILKEPIFRKLSIPDTMKDEIISKDSSGRPLKDEEGNMIKKTKEVGELVFSNNLINIHTFISDFNDLVTKCIDAKVDGYNESDKVEQFLNDRNFQNFLSFAIGSDNREYEVDFEIFNRDIYLKINHNPKDILNMSISKFYASCQHLYTGGYASQVLGNVFDPNSIPAFLMFDTPIFWKGEKIADQLPLSRMMIRSLEQFDEKEVKIYFDRAYYDRMQNIFEDIVTKYSGNINNSESGETYLYTPDIDNDDMHDLSTPYMDRLRLKSGRYIGLNTKTLHLSQSANWSTYKISPKAKIKELIVETTELPENLLDLKINLEWVKFRYIEINTLSNFENIKTDSLAFDKCKFGNNVLVDINKINPNINKLQIISCDNKDSLDFSIFEKLEELHVIYTLDSIDELKNILNTTKLKKLVISGDLFSRENKTFINSVKAKGIKVEIVGPVM